jgi:serine/threonine-protein kinase
MDSRGDDEAVMAAGESVGPGARIAGYRVLDRVGRGGMAVVFRADDERLGRVVALKVLAPVLAEDDAFRQRFIRESRAAAAVDDPHIIPVFEAGEAGGVLFLAMRYVAGGDVRLLVRRTGPLTASRAASIVSPVASALDAAHAVGLVHRDVKPANMLIDARRGRPDHVYLSDFGLSKGALSSVGLTGSGLFLGTPDYVAPEQIAGREVDGRADQYALACTVFEMLSGQPPFSRDHGMAVIYAHASELPPALTSRCPGLLLAAIQGERHLGGRVVAGERDFRDGSGCGRVACDDTVSVSDKGRPSPVPFSEAPGRAVRCAEAPLLTVGNSAAVAEELLGKGLLACPGCGGRLGGWGHAVRRRVFTAGRFPVAVRPRRARCASCGVTHVLLPAWLLSRRCDAVPVIGDMLALAARGQGFRSIAAASGVPADTVRGRLRRFRGSAGRVREHFTRLAGVLAADPVPLDPAGSAAGDAVVAVAAAAAAAQGRWPAFTVSPWEFAAVVTRGSLLSPAVAFRSLRRDLPPSALG